MLNILHPKLKSSVFCSSVCEDDYPATNLISNDLKEQSRGFMAFSVSKPPCDLTFNFNYKIDIHKVKIWTQIGSLQSNGFEIKIKNKEIFYKIANVFNVNDPVITFCRNKTNCMEKEIQFFNLKHSQKILEDVSSVQVTIKTTKKCPPVLRKIEIWGTLSKSVDKKLKDRILRIWDDVLHPSSPPRQMKRALTNPLSITCTNIPDDFLDEITYEIMLFPMTLPSGKLVDQSTIEKHSFNEEKWGRLPSDPFTGQCFTSARKPLLNLALKARIEKFLLENSEKKEIQLLPRTVGMKRKSMSYYAPTNTNAKCTITSHSLEKRIKMEDNENSLNESLIHNDIKKALATITRYTHPLLSNKNLQNNQNECYNCKLNENLYKITICNHILCKLCLSQYNKKKKCPCDVDFATCDVEKVQ